MNDLLLCRSGHPHRPSLENRVAYQWEMDGDVLGHFNGSKKNRVTLEWLADCVAAQSGSRAVLDVGCAYGNMLLMLNAKLGKPRDVRLVGIDLYPESMRYAQAFASQVPGYANCEFATADLATRLPFQDGTFDAVNLGDVLEHMEDPAAAVRELMRVTRPGGAIVISTPLKNGLFKRLAALANRLSGGKLYRDYYRGKETELDAEGQPVMLTKAGHDHISEMTLPELETLLKQAGLKIEAREMMPVMSGSKWFDRHLVLLSALFFLEAIHGVLKRPSWAHSVMLRARLPG